MQLNIIPKTVHGIELHEALIVLNNGQQITATHASWQGAYQWLERTAKRLAGGQQ
jgi:hypothetical protein